MEDPVIYTIQTRRAQRTRKRATAGSRKCSLLSSKRDRESLKESLIFYKYLAFFKLDLSCTADPNSQPKKYPRIGADIILVLDSFIVQAVIMFTFRIRRHHIQLYRLNLVLQDYYHIIAKQVEKKKKTHNLDLLHFHTTSDIRPRRYLSHVRQRQDGPA